MIRPHSITQVLDRQTKCWGNPVVRTHGTPVHEIRQKKGGSSLSLIPEVERKKKPPKPQTSILLVITVRRMVSPSTLKVVKDAPRPDRGRTSIPLLLSNHTTPDRLYDQGVLQRKQRHVEVQSRCTKRKSGHHREVRQRNARLVARHMETHRRIPETIDERPQNQQNGPRLLTPSRYNTPPRDHVAKRTTIQKLPRPRRQNLLLNMKRSRVP
ncbi:hypothetical protein RND81_12G063000 [Saponaria officinalis]|uniref:Uncharacterized protein n=1 Tax=Saponaria officinalis TaxID=3572 RepID=A0AAW1H5Y3_SAPOF